MALTGAMSPGPLFTYTIIKSIQSKRHGYLMGFWIIAGHAILEMFIVLIFLAGFAYFFNSTLAIRVIAVIGGALLILFGTSLLNDIKKGRIPTDFLEKYHDSTALENKNENTTGQTEANSSSKLVKNPVMGGILVSMSNPYWWIWWATIGVAVMLQYNISFSNTIGVAAFFLGHEMGDLSWYVIVSMMAFYGRRTFNKKAYYGILTFCGCFMIGFGLYLGISPFFL